MKLFIKIVLGCIIALVLIGGGSAFYLTRGLEAGKEVTAEKIDASGVKDGIYEGKYTSGRWTNTVKVTVKNEKITKIDVVDDVAIPKSEWTKQLLDSIIEKQNTDVDIISGATVTSKAYMKAIEDALKKAK